MPMPGLNYDFKMVADGRVVQHTIRMTFALNAYRFEATETVIGNDMGVLALFCAMDRLIIRTCEENDGKFLLVMEDAAGNTIDCDGGGDPQSFVAEALIGYEVTAIEQAEIRLIHVAGSDEDAGRVRDGVDDSGDSVNGP